MGLLDCEMHRLAVTSPDGPSRSQKSAATMTLSAMSQVAARAAIRGRNAAALGQQVIIPRHAALGMSSVASTGAPAHHVSRALSTRSSSVLISAIAPHQAQQPHSNTLSSSRALFSTEPKVAGSDAVEEAAEMGDNIIEPTGDNAATKKRKKKAPSILKSLPENYTTGVAFYALRNKAAGGQNIRLSDFCDLALSARRGYKRDAVSILTALKDFKRNNAFILNVPGAAAAMEGMLRSRTPVDNEEYGDPTALDRVEASLYVLGAFVDEKTGLYYATETEVVESNMKLLLEAVRDADLRLPAGYGADTKSDDEEDSEDDDAGDDDGDAAAVDTSALAERVLNVTKDTMAALIKRGRDPTKHMKKRAARKYRKHLRVEEGPTPSTAHVGVEICLALGASATLTRETVLSPYQSKPKYENWFPRADDATVELVQNAEKAEQEAIRAAEEEAKAAAAAAAEAEAAQVAEDEATGEGESESEESSEEKKD